MSKLLTNLLVNGVQPPPLESRKKVGQAHKTKGVQAIVLELLEWMEPQLFLTVQFVWDIMMLPNNVFMLSFGIW